MKNYDFPLWEPSRKYVCPVDASASWRELYEMGYDLAGFEDNLKLTPEERLAKHHRVINDFLKREEFFRMLRRAGEFIQKIESSRNIQQSTI